MNGRVYDQLLGQFIQPDNNISLPESSQGYNRYSYVLNNPLKYTDPSGEWIIPLAIALIKATYSGIQAANFGGAGAGWSSFATSMGYSALTYGIAQGLGAIADGLVTASGEFANGLTTDYLGTEILTEAGGMLSGAIANIGSSAIMAGINNSKYELSSFIMDVGMGVASGPGKHVAAKQGVLDELMKEMSDKLNIEGGNSVNKNDTWEKNKARAEVYGRQQRTQGEDIDLQRRFKDEYNIEIGDYNITDITTKAPRELGLTEDGIFITKNGDLKAGRTVFTGEFTSSIHIAPRFAREEIYLFKSIAGHELIHASHLFVFGKSNIKEVFTETVAYEYSMNMLIKGGYYQKAYYYNLYRIKNGYSQFDPKYMIYPFSK